MQQNYEIKYLLTRLQKKKHVCRRYRKCVIIEVQLRRRALSLPDRTAASLACAGFAFLQRCYGGFFFQR